MEESAVGTRVLTITGYAMLAEPLVLAGIVYFCARNALVHQQFAFYPAFYALALAAGPVYAVAVFIRRQIWEARKPTVKSRDDFHAAMLVMTIIPMAVVQGAGLLGVVVFFLTAEPRIAYLMLAVSGGMLTFFLPSDERMAQWRQQVLLSGAHEQ